VPALLYAAGTADGGSFVDSPYTIAGGCDGCMPPMYRCGRCGHGFAPSAGPDTFAWYAAAPPDGEYLAEERGRRVAARRVLRRLAKHIRPPGRLLDLGAGAGFFVEEAAAAGWFSEGLEAARWAVERSRSRGGPPVWLGDARDLRALECGTFDVVTAFDVIEHLEDPLVFLRGCAAALRPGGVLVLTTPRFDSLAARICGARWHALLPAHLHYFSRRSLRAALEQAGFHILAERSHRRYFSAAYIAFRLCATPVRGAWMRRIVLPVNIGDEFELYAARIGADGTV